MAYKIAVGENRILILKSAFDLASAEGCESFLIMDGEKIAEVYRLLGSPAVGFWSSITPVIKMGEKPFEAEWKTVHKNAKANPNLYSGLWTNAKDKKAFIQSRFNKLVMEV